jgi:hypothetical protein
VAESIGDRVELNGIDPERLRGYLDTAHGLTDDLEASNARFRDKINDTYDAACKELHLPKSVLKLVFRRERDQIKIEEKLAMCSAREAEALERCGQAFGDLPMGEWCTRMSKIVAEPDPPAVVAEPPPE